MPPSATNGHYCPICATRFNNVSQCRQHLNQPHGRCNAAFHPSVLRAAKTITRTYGLGVFQEEEVDQESEWEEPSAPDFSDGFPVRDRSSSLSSSPEPAAQPLGVSNNPEFEYFKGASQTFGRGTTFMDDFDKDPFAKQRAKNLYYPFASSDEWAYAAFLSNANISVSTIDQLLKLRLVKKMHLSFRTAKELRSRVEMLPKGPEWKAIPWRTEYPTKNSLTLYYRDPLECLQSLLSNPLVQDFIHFTPFRLWANSEKLMRIYTEWLSGDVAWNMQEQLPPGSTLLGTILSSDKTQLTAMTGNRSAYPLLISLADIDMDFRMKASHHAFLLLSLLPIAKFREKDPEIRGVLASRLFHAILDFILEPLKRTAEIGMMMNDPLGWRRFCYTPLTTIAMLSNLEETTHPYDLATYIKSAKALGLNGVHRPFWRDWPLAEPSLFLTPEILHHWLKMFYDHLCKWCIEAVGAAEIDFRFGVLRPHTGMRHFKEGISNTKQTTGREHRDIQRYIVAVIADAKGVSKNFLATISSLVDFFYHGQAPVIGDNVLDKMDASLDRFHDHKQAVLDAGARRGKNGPIENWHIPKLEFLQSVVPAIRANGVALQWSADVTEHAHITLVKDPASHSNNQRYEAQICRHLDRRERCRRFDLATAIKTAGVEFGAELRNHAQGDEPSLLVDSTADLLDEIDPVTRLSGTSRVLVNYFRDSALLEEGKFPNAPIPHRTFTSLTGSTAFHLTRDHTGRQMEVDSASIKFGLPDLRPALATYLYRQSSPQLVIGGRRPMLANHDLHFGKLEIWNNVRIQNRSFHDASKILPPETINAWPPDGVWKCGRADAVLVNIDSGCEWPRSGLQGKFFNPVCRHFSSQLNIFLGHAICQLRMIFRVVPRRSGLPPPGARGFLAYVHRFDFQQNDASGMYLVKRARRADNSAMGDIVPLDRLRKFVERLMPVELTPRFGKAADRRLSKETSLDLGDDFWLSKWFNKEFFFALSH
ncbi:hypothetical protein C8F04DRAFT_955065 [Mycena alexandri]|uniref:C2H2-type domain-containing protein n=1 Tax=Mycena alexandri TaxID=1745969 RepID=A0AAD6T028_9AGAR|nr:hypothetical protein C8F04DRAFT_955065 [Mycena alexandri]